MPALSSSRPRERPPMGSAINLLLANLTLAVALGGSAMAQPVSGLDIPSAVGPMEPVQAISFPDLRLQNGPLDTTADAGTSVSELRSPCRNYADEPSVSPDPKFAECWNEKKTAWDRTKPSAVGLDGPQMNTPLAPGSIKSGAPRETPVP